MPIVMGFQLEALIECLVTRFRKYSGEDVLIRTSICIMPTTSLPLPMWYARGRSHWMSISKIRLTGSMKQASLPTGLSWKRSMGWYLFNFQRESTAPLCMSGVDFSTRGDIDAAAARNRVAHDRYFMKCGQHTGSEGYQYPWMQSVT